MRVLLIQPAIEDFYITAQRLQPTGLLYLASHLASHGHEVELLDFLSPLTKTEIPLDEDLRYLGPLLEKAGGPSELFGAYRRFGASPETARTILRTKEFDVCGVSANFAAYWKTALEACKIVRETHPAAHVVVGGNSVPVCWREYLGSGAVNAVVFGEGENTMLGLLECLRNGKNFASVPNIAYLENERPVRTPVSPNFDIADSSISLNFPGLEARLIGRRRILSLVTSRGCPASCSYCTANLNCLSGHQQAPLENVWRDIDDAVGRFGVSALDLEDENFTRDRDYALSFLEWKIAVHPGVRLYFMNGLDYRFLDDGLLTALRKADLLNLGLALVDDTVSSGQLDRAGSADRFAAIAAKAKELGFRITAYFIAGLPGQTPDGLDRLVSFLHSLGAVIGMSVYYPVPGTRLFEENRGRFDGLAFTRMRSTALVSASDGVTPEILLRLFRKVRELNAGLKD